MSNARDKANIPSLNFSSTGIDDNANATAITITSGNNVGIGNTGHSLRKLDITQTSGLQAGVRVVTDGSGAYYQMFGGVAQTKIGSSHNTQDIEFHNGSGEQMRIDSSGNVGIGTTTMDGKLHIQSNSAGSVTAHVNGSLGVFEASGNNGISILTPDASTSAIFFGSASSNRFAEIKATYDNNFLDIGTRKSGGLIRFATDNFSERMRISSSGVVSIGTTSSSGGYQVKVAGSNAPLELARTTGDTNERSHLGMSREGTFVGQFKSDATNLWLEASAGGLIINTGGGSESMRINSSGSVGIGTSSPGTIPLNVVTTDGGNVDEILELRNNATNAGTGVRLRLVSSTDVGSIPNSVSISSYRNAGSDIDLLFETSSTERMRINSSGNILIGLTSLPTAGQGGVSFEQDGIIKSSRTSDATLTHHDFYNPNGLVGTIKTGGSSTSFNTSSDYRLKENVSYDFDATTRLKQLKPARFNFIADADTTVDGFLAHEVSDIVPEAISGEKDATETKEKVVVNANGNVIAENIEQADWEDGKIADEDGNTKYPTDSTWEATKVVPVYQGIDQSKLVPLLVKTIQELEARITALETNQP